MRYLADIAHAFMGLLLIAALAGLSFATAIEWRKSPAALPVAPAIVASKAPPSARSTIPPPAEEARLLVGRHLLIPVEGVTRASLHDTFDDKRGLRRHEALDIMAPRGTPVLAVSDGRVMKLFHSVLGGITIYEADPDEKYIYYYAHLDRYADGLKDGQVVKRGEVIGYVGSTGNAPANAPHLHFTIFRMSDDKKWWKGTAVNPFSFLVEARR
ncbi:MAG: M23 family metallopeptidase [Bacillota bacterium]